MEAALFMLTALVLVREYQHQRIVRDLIDRLMSRDYSSFKFAENYGKQDKAPAPIVEEFSEPDTLEGINPLT